MAKKTLVIKDIMLADAPQTIETVGGEGRYLSATASEKAVLSK